MSSPPGEPRRIGYLYLLPALLVYGAFLLYPLGRSVHLSLFEWDGISLGKFVGLSNYADVVADAGLRAAFGHALVPPARPALVTLIVLVFMWTWNEFLIPLVMVTSESLRTAPLGLAFFSGQYTSGFTLLAAGAVIVGTPVVLVYAFLQRHFIAGMLEGAVRE